MKDNSLVQEKETEETCLSTQPENNASDSFIEEIFNESKTNHNENSKFKVYVRIKPSHKSAAKKECSRSIQNTENCIWIDSKRGDSNFYSVSTQNHNNYSHYQTRNLT